jgi:choline-sulfatase
MHGKNVFFEESIRIPMLVAMPGVVRSGAHDDLVETTDVVPTLMELCGLPVPERVQGRSVAGLLSSGAVGSPYAPREFVVAENIIPEVFTPRYERDARYAYVPGQGVAGIRHPDAKMIRDRRWKYCHYVGNGAELYDLEKDPRERRNLAGDPAHREVVERMRCALLDWLITCDEREQIAPRWLPADERAGHAAAAP